MAQKLHHTSLDLLIHPGETIAELLEDRDITQKELAIRTGFTEKHISTVINGKKSISAKLAIRLENALDIPSSFWRNLQMNYDLELEEFTERNNITSNELEIAKEITHPVEVITGQAIANNGSAFEVITLRQLLGVNNLETLAVLNSGFYRGQFEVNTSNNIMYVWQYLSEKECETQTENTLDIQKLIDYLPKIKDVMFEDAHKHISLIQHLLNECGVVFTVKRHVSKAPINGITVQTKNKRVMIAMTIRGKYVDIFWFSLFHELAHVINKDFLINQDDISTTNLLEENADRFAMNALIDSGLYSKFIAEDNFTDEKIITFAKTVKVLPTIVAGRLMKEGYIPWNKNHLRTKYEWSDEYGNES